VGELAFWPPAEISDRAAATSSVKARGLHDRDPDERSGRTRAAVFSSGSLINGLFLS
jgi:hypothetical protein